MKLFSLLTTLTIAVCLAVCWGEKNLNRERGILEQTNSKFAGSGGTDFRKLVEKPDRVNKYRDHLPGSAGKARFSGAGIIQHELTPKSAMSNALSVRIGAFGDDYFNEETESSQEFLRDGAQIETLGSRRMPPEDLRDMYSMRFGKFLGAGDYF